MPVRVLGQEEQKRLITKAMKTYTIISKKTATRQELRQAGISIQSNTYVTEYNYLAASQKKMIINLMLQGRLQLISDTTTKADKIRHQRKIENGDTIHQRHLTLTYDLISRRRSFALYFAENYHKNIKSLYTSERASIEPFSGHLGNLNNVDHDAYAKSYGFPARWKNAGVVIRGREFDIYTARETLVYTGIIPARAELSRYNFEACTHNDLYTIRVRNNVYERYSKTGKRVGYAMMLKHPRTGKDYYEHGDSIAQIKREYRHKQKMQAE